LAVASTRPIASAFALAPDQEPFKGNDGVGALPRQLGRSRTGDQKGHARVDTVARYRWKAPRFCIAASRPGPFRQTFNLAEHVKVTNATFEHGLLIVELKREVPEALKPRRIEIATRHDSVGQTKGTTLEHNKAA
jgi:hypothetical protein